MLPPTGSSVAKFAEVLLDHFAVVRGEIAADLLDGFFPLLGRRSPQPLLRRCLSDHVAGAFALDRRLPRPGCWGFPAPPAICCCCLLLIFDLLDHFVQRIDRRPPPPYARWGPARPRSKRRWMSFMRRAMWSNDSCLSPSRSACINLAKATYRWDNVRYCPRSGRHLAIPPRGSTSA